MHHPTDRITYSTVFVTPVMEHWLEREIAQWVHHEGLIRWPITPWVNTLTTEIHITPDRRKMFYATTLSFYLLSYGIRQCKWPLSEKRNLLLPLHGLFFNWLAARNLLYALSHRQDNIYHSLVTPVVKHWLE